MEWLLILTFLTASGASVAQVEFATQTHCVRAIEVLRETQPGLEFAASCVKTRGEPPGVSEMFTSKRPR